MMLGPMLMCEVAARCAAIGEAPTEALLRDAGQQYGYALDATDEIPAGTVDWYADPDLPEIAGALPRVVDREAC